MTDRSTTARQISRLPSSGVLPASQSNSSGSVRPRNRRLVSGNDADADADAASTRSTNSAALPAREPGLLSTWSPSTSRNGSPLPARRSGVGSTDPPDDGNLGQFLSESWTQSWSSLQGFTSSLLQGGEDTVKRAASPLRGPSSGLRQSALSRQHSNISTTRNAGSWGPAPPSSTPGLDDVATGSKSMRETALKAARTASVLESHDGVNGGLDVVGKHKRRNSDDITPDRAPPEDYLVYVHHVQPSDTYVGLILRYKCREDAFRRANGLWSREAVQTRKWLVIPVDTCDIRGRPCDPPSWHNAHGVDLLAPTPTAVAEDKSGSPNSHDDFFSRPINGEDGDPSSAEEERPWVHVRWVQVESFPQPVEVGRVSRQAMGYFPPRRRRSIRTASGFSTPRQSVDLSSVAPGSAEGPASRRLSTSSSRPYFSGTPASGRSRGGSDGADGRPAWMRRPGGVGSMGRSVRAPGPGNDYFNKWTTKHMPGLNMDGLPSMSIMGSEVAHFGFNGKDMGSLVESAVEDGRDASLASRQGTGLDRAAAAVETWLRGALTKRPTTPLVGNRGKPGGGNLGDGDGDLIELTDTASDDGRILQDQGVTLMSSLSLLGSSGRSDGGGGSVRGRATGAGDKGKKHE